MDFSFIWFLGKWFKVNNGFCILSSLKLNPQIHLIELHFGESWNVFVLKLIPLRLNFLLLRSWYCFCFTFVLILWSVKVSCPVFIQTHYLILPVIRKACSVLLLEAQKLSIETWDSIGWNILKLIFQPIF